MANIRRNTRARCARLFLLGLAAAGLVGCYVIVPVVNFGHMTIPQGDTGFLNRYEARFEQGAAGMVAGATGTGEKKKTVKDYLFKE